MNSNHFIKALRMLCFENTFNPYSDRCPVHDIDNAPKLRSSALQSMLEAAIISEVDAIWIGRDLGYRGGRRTGLALTDDAHITVHAERWGISVERPTKGEIILERTAAVIWKILSQIDVSVFLWNVFPLHPHEPDNPFSNRSHNSHERQVGEDLLSQLIILLKPQRLIAIGNDAMRSARRLSNGHDVIQIRHPSYGGQTQFLSQMQELYELHEASPPLPTGDQSKSTPPA